MGSVPFSNIAFQKGDYMNKLNYERLSILITELEAEDVIVTSSPGKETGSAESEFTPPGNKEGYFDNFADDDELFLS